MPRNCVTRRSYLKPGWRVLWKRSKNFVQKNRWLVYLIFCVLAIAAFVIVACLLLLKGQKSGTSEGGKVALPNAILTGKHKNGLRKGHVQKQSNVSPSKSNRMSTKDVPNSNQQSTDTVQDRGTLSPKGIPHSKSAVGTTGNSTGNQPEIPNGNQPGNPARNSHALTDGKPKDSPKKPAGGSKAHKEFSDTFTINQIMKALNDRMSTTSSTENDPFHDQSTILAHHDQTIANLPRIVENKCNHLSGNLSNFMDPLHISTSQTADLPGGHQASTFLDQCQISPINPMVHSTPMRPTSKSRLGHKSKSNPKAGLLTSAPVFIEPGEELLSCSSSSEHFIDADTATKSHINTIESSKRTSN